MKNLRLYQTEADYTSDPIEREYPTVSYIQDTDQVYYEEKASSCVYLPCIDTTGYPTEFQVDQSYPQVRNIFNEIMSMYNLSQTTPSENGVRFYKSEEKWFLDVSGNHYDITNEPLIVNYFSKIAHNDYQICTWSWSNDIIIDETQLEGSWNSENWEFYTFNADGTYRYMDMWT